MPSPSPKIPLLKGWPASVKSGVLHVMALAQFAMTYARGWAADSVNTRVRLKAELDQANQDNALLREEIRIKDPRMAQLDPHHWPQCWPLGSPCAKPWALVRGKPGAKVQCEVAFHVGRRHLPVVCIKRAA